MLYTIDFKMSPCHSADVDECATANGGCDQNCHNSIGSYNCSCNIGFLLDEDNHGCSGNAKSTESES